MTTFKYKDAAGDDQSEDVTGIDPPEVGEQYTLIIDGADPVELSVRDVRSSVVVTSTAGVLTTFVDCELA